MIKFFYLIYFTVIHYTSEIPDVDMALDFFSKSFLSIVNKHAPYKRLRIKNRSIPWFTSGLSILLRNRNRAWSLARHSGDQSHWTFLDSSEIGVQQLLDWLKTIAI